MVFYQVTSSSLYTTDGTQEVMGIKFVISIWQRLLTRTFDVTPNFIFYGKELSYLKHSEKVYEEAFSGSYLYMLRPSTRLTSLNHTPTSIMSTV